MLYAVKNNRGAFVYFGKVVATQGWIEFDWPRNVAGIQFQIPNATANPAINQSVKKYKGTDSIQNVFVQFRWQGGVLGVVPISHANSYYAVPPGLGAMIAFANSQIPNNAPSADRVKIRVFAPVNVDFRLIAFNLVFE